MIRTAARLTLLATQHLPCGGVRRSPLLRFLRPTEGQIPLVVEMVPWLVLLVRMILMKGRIAEEVDRVAGGNLYQLSSGMAAW